MSLPTPSTSSPRPPVAILCGGLGTRLRAVVPGLPKALAPIAGRPFLAWLLDLLESHGFTRVVLCTGYGADQIENEFGARYGGITLEYSREPAPLGTAGALRHALPLLGPETVMVVNGDSYCQADLTQFWRGHLAADASASMLLTQVDDSARYGSVEIEDDGLVVAFREKLASAGRGWINAGIYLIRSPLLATIPTGQPCSLERDIFPKWIGLGLRGAKSDGPFIDIGTPESFAAAEEFFAPFPDRPPFRSLVNCPFPSLP